METIVKDTVYTREDLATKDLQGLQHILSDRGIGFHHANKEDALIEKIIASNPEVSNGIQETETENLAVATATNEVIDRVETVSSTTSGIVLLELVESKRTGSLRVRDYTDLNGTKRVLQDKNGDAWVYMITKNEKLDIATHEGSALYEHLKQHPYVIGGNGLVPAIRLVNEGQEAVENVNLIEDAIEAQNIIRNLGEKDLRDFARVLKITVAHKASPVVVKSKAYDMCKVEPKTVITMWNDPRRDLRCILYKGMDKGLILKIDGVLKYDTLPVGTTFDEMVLWFEKNPDILPGLRNKLN